MQGKLGQLVQLIQSMSFLTGGLASMMAAFRPQQGSLSSLAHTSSTAAELAAASGLLSSKQQLQQQWAAAGEGVVLAASVDEGDVTVEVLIGCVLAAVEELPVWESTEVEQVGANGLLCSCVGGMHTVDCSPQTPRRPDTTVMELGFTNCTFDGRCFLSCCCCSMRCWCWT
jgi:hypothetical protein